MSDIEDYMAKLSPEARARFEAYAEWLRASMSEAFKEGPLRPADIRAYLAEEFSRIETMRKLRSAEIIVEAGEKPGSFDVLIPLDWFKSTMPVAD